MPRVYLTSEDKRKQEIISLLTGMAAGKQKELSNVWDISQQAVSYKLKHGNVTLLDLYKAREVLEMDLHKITFMIGG